ncbi:hypothetical protein SGM_3707 [Streptomyces griseoaurantiacus M045]|uniref:Uncharacterized protein n=1 Tax=Streptomyces griseoaurantiacus M045 TaxID=996637 RepID=F3NKP3_9ACTN|nr:hypothetical protein SGM_3707 [Streptomyces griseoaurantiacus M045]
MPAHGEHTPRTGQMGSNSDVNAPPVRSPGTPFAPSSGSVATEIRAGTTVDFRPIHPRDGRFEYAPYRLWALWSGARSGRRNAPPGPVRRPRGCRRRRPPAHRIQYSGPTHAPSIEPLPPWPEKSARTGARPHGRGTPRHCVLPRRSHPANRKNAP